MSDRKIRLLKKAAKDGHSIIHFSNLKDKLGINPKTKYSTPAGVYGYILTEESLDLLLDFKTNRFNQSKIFQSDAFSSFALDRKYVYIAEVNPTLNRMIINVNKEGLSKEIEYNFSSLMSRLSYLYDSDESYFVNDVTTLAAWENKDFDFFDDKRKPEYKNKTRLFWNMTRLLSRNPIAWGRLLYDLGISAVFDYGAGLIHPAEPSQAVILETHQIEVLHHGINEFSMSDEEEKIALRSLKKIVRLFEKDNEEHNGSLIFSSHSDNLPDWVSELGFSYYTCKETPYYIIVSIKPVTFNDAIRSLDLHSIYFILDLNLDKTYITVSRDPIYREHEIRLNKKYYRVFSLPANNLNFEIFTELDFLPSNSGELVDLFFDFWHEVSMNTSFKKQDIENFKSNFENQGILNYFVNDHGIAENKTNYIKFIFDYKEINISLNFVVDELGYIEILVYLSSVENVSRHACSLLEGINPIFLNKHDGETSYVLAKAVRDIIDLAKECIDIVEVKANKDDFWDDIFEVRNLLKKKIKSILSEYFEDELFIDISYEE